MRFSASAFCVLLLAGSGFVADAAWAQHDDLSVEVVHSEAYRDKFLTVHSSPGWYLIERDQGAYRIGIEAAPDLEGRQVVFIRAIRPPRRSGALERTIDAAEYAGKRVKVSSRLKKSPHGFGNFWINSLNKEGRIIKTVGDRVYHPCTQPGFFTPAGETPLTNNCQGTAPWREQAMILDIPASAATLEVGYSIWGHPQVMGWTDVVRLEVVDAAAPLHGVDALFEGGRQLGIGPSQLLGDPPPQPSR